MKNNNFKSFLLKLMLFFVTLGITDFVIGSLLRKYYFKQKGGFEFLTSYALEETDAEVLIFGSSRAVNLYNTLLFEEQLKMSCYNTGRYGHPIFYHYAILHANLKRHTPKLAILSFDAGNFSVNQSSYDQLSVLLPYYQDHPEIRKVIDLKGPFEKLKMVSAIYPYNSMIIPIIAGNSERSKFKFANIKGYIPLTKEIKGPLKNIDYTKETVLDSVKINTYKAFLQLCINSNIKLYVVCPPYLINAKGTDLSIKTAIEINKQYQVDFLDYSRDTFFTSKPKLFYDFRHLNEKGVEIFTQKVIGQINNFNN